MKKVKVALVGCGGFGRFHLNHLKKMDEAELVAVVSSDPVKIAKLQEEYPMLRGYADTAALIAREKELDAMIICVPPACHGDAELLAARNGIHLFVEKPVGLDLTACEAIEQEIRKQGIISSVGYQGRYNPHFTQLKQELDGKTVGLAAARFICPRPGAAWWSDPLLSGGQIVEQTTHLFDILRYFFGEVSQVACMQNPQSDSECSIATLRFHSGLLASVTSGCYLSPDQSTSDVSFTLYAQDVQVDVDWNDRIRFTTGAETVNRPFKQNNHFNCLHTFIKAVQTGQQSLILSDYSDALQTLRLTLAVSESISTGYQINL